MSLRVDTWFWALVVTKLKSVCGVAFASVLCQIADLGFPISDLLVGGADLLVLLSLWHFAVLVQSKQIS